MGELNKLTKPTDNKGWAHYLKAIDLGVGTKEPRLETQPVQPQLIQDATDQELLDRVAKLERNLRFFYWIVAAIYLLILLHIVINH
jgi:hypothetical protein